MTDHEARIRSLEQAVYTVAVAVRDLQLRIVLESSLTNVRLCEGATRHATLTEDLHLTQAQCAKGFTALTGLLHALLRSLQDDRPDEWGDFVEF